jgi:hypothetical protein
MRTSFIATAVALGSLTLAGCRDVTAPSAGVAVAGAASYRDAVVTDPVADSPAESAPGCTFDRGTSTCVATTERFETSTHDVFSGCVAGPPPFKPGRRIRTFEDTYSIVTTTTTYQHGRNGKVYDTEITEQRQLVSSREISSTCEAT